MLRRLRDIAFAGIGLLAVAAAAPAQEQPAPPPGGAFDFEAVQARARELAAKPYDEGAIHLEDWLKQFSYDDYREIEYRREKGLWHATGRPFQIQFHHRGGLFPNPVKVHVVRDDAVEDVKFDPELFNYRASPIGGPVPDDLGFAGFKVLTPLNADHFDEVLSFLGASYFRGLGKGNHYGLSARALAINSSKWGHEEFPWFREFWIVESESAEPNLRIYALLDSQSVTGAYQFDLKPGDPTRLEVRCTLYIRKAVGELGIAPLTSMYLHGETDPFPVGLDFRPSVHDSDGLAVHFPNGERLWRPLQNPKFSMASKVAAVEGVRGFGLVQRDRDFGNYQDLEAVYQRRPTCWIEPLDGSFGPGHVKLLELHSMSEANDSTVAYYVPAKNVEAGETLTFAYAMIWGGETADALAAGSGHVVATRQQGAANNGTRFVLDWAGPALDPLPTGATVSAVVTADGGNVGPPVVQRNPYNGTWRSFFDVTPSGPEPVSLRAFLKNGEHVVTETWSFRCVP